MRVDFTMTLVGDAIMARWARRCERELRHQHPSANHSGMAINHGALERNAVTGGRAPSAATPPPITNVSFIPSKYLDFQSSYSRPTAVDAKADVRQYAVPLRMHPRSYPAVPREPRPMHVVISVARP